MGRWWVAVLALGSALPGVGPLEAQSSPDSVRATVESALRPGAFVRASAMGTRIRGVVEGTEDGFLLLRPEQGGETLRLDGVGLDSLWVRGDAAGAGAAVGTVLGLIPVLATCGREVDECGLVPNGVAVVGLSAAVGYLVGRGIEAWRRVLP